jgi:hypothetical protein
LTTFGFGRFSLKISSRGVLPDAAHEPGSRFLSKKPLTRAPVSGILAVMEFAELIKPALVVLAGLAAGFINTMAGGGSLLTIPALIFLGLPSTVANGTNRIAILAQNTVAVANFRKKGYSNWKHGLILGATATAGALVGSNIAVELPPEVFTRILSIIMISVLIDTLFGNIKQKARQIASEELSNPGWVAFLFFFVGIYGGFIQAGVGFIVIAVLTLVGQVNLVRTNSIKMLVVFIYTVPALAVFILNGKVHLLYGLLLAVGNSVGAYIGSSVAVKKGDRLIRIVMAVAVTGMAVKLFLGA